VHASLYVDGARDVSLEHPGGLPPDDYPVWIGGNSLMLPEWYWNGWIDDVRIYDYALTAEEVQALHEATKDPLGKPAMERRRTLRRTRLAELAGRESGQRQGTSDRRWLRIGPARAHVLARSVAVWQCRFANGDLTAGY